jgi:hypothetical protein
MYADHQSSIQGVLKKKMLVLRHIWKRMGMTRRQWARNDLKRVNWSKVS